jgi:hypothetical protein
LLKILLKVSNRLISENSPYLVTLVENEGIANIFYNPLTHTLLPSLAAIREFYKRFFSPQV